MPAVDPIFPADLWLYLHKVSAWLFDPWLHLANNEYQWAEAFERVAGEPTPEMIAPLGSRERFEVRDGKTVFVPGPLGVEPPSSFWPKFEHRFRPAEQVWFDEALPAVVAASPDFDRAIELFDQILTARDELAEALPQDGRTPTTRAEGQSILNPMRKLMGAIDAFTDYLGVHKPPPPSGRKEKRAARVAWKALEKEIQVWRLAGPNEGLNY
jgi:hypothetical protein